VAQESTFGQPSNGRHSGPLVCEFIVEPFFGGKRIDTFLGKHLRNYSPFRLQRMLKAGCVTVNDAPAETSHRVRPNELIRIKLFSPPDHVAVPAPLPLEVIYEDPWLLAVNKPPGQIAHPGGEFEGKTLLNAIQFYVDQRTPLPGLIRPGIVHRIDRQTSGVMIVPKHHLPHRKLTQQFTRGEISKTYIAILRGCLPEDSGLIDLPIGVVPNPNCTLSCAKPIAVDAKSARTRFQVLERFRDYTLVEARPLTGRHHQIRIHFAEIGYPLLADEFYDRFGVIKDGTPLELPDGELPADRETLGDDDENESDDEEFFTSLDESRPPFYDPDLPLRRHALHAASIQLDHPIMQMPIAFEAPLPDEMQQTLTKLRTGNVDHNS
jgi:23S rRNA pseudouridine1911/1915/1917 synthase